MQSVSLVDLLPKRTYLYYLRKKYLGLGFLKEHYLLLASLRDSMDEFSQEELLPPSSPKILKPWFAQVSTFLTPSTNNLMILFSGEATFLVHIVVHEKAKNQANHKTSYNCTEIPIRPEKEVCEMGRHWKCLRPEVWDVANEPGSNSNALVLWENDTTGLGAVLA